MTPHLYDLLDVDPDATPDEIRAAWRTASADLDPGDRRFRAYSEAAAVLLDPVRRAEYDATLAEAAEPEPEPAPVVLSKAKPESEPAPEPVMAAESEHAAEEDDPEDEPGDEAPAARSALPLAVVVAVAVVTALLVALTAVTAVAWIGSDAAPESISTRPPEVDEKAAQAAAETAVLDVLAYDYRDPDAGADAARAFMTDDYREEYDKLFAVIKENLPRTQTVVTVELVASGIVRSSDDRVDVLLFVNRPTVNKQVKEPVVYRDQVTLQMLLVDGKWLVDKVISTPAAP